jgi:hypothetical protein
MIVTTQRTRKRNEKTKSASMYLTHGPVVAVVVVCYNTRHELQDTRDANVPLNNMHPTNTRHPRHVSFSSSLSSSPSFACFFSSSFRGAFCCGTTVVGSSAAIVAVTVETQVEVEARVEIEVTEQQSAA